MDKIDKTESVILQQIHHSLHKNTSFCTSKISEILSFTQNDKKTATTSHKSDFFRVMAEYSMFLAIRQWFFDECFNSHFQPNPNSFVIFAD